MRSILFLLISSLLLYGCGGKKKGKTTVNIQLTKGAAAGSVSGSGAPQWGLPVPGGIASFNCYGVFISYPDQAKDSNCKDSDFNIVSQPHEMVGSLPVGAILEAEVRNVKGAKFQVIGFQSSSGDCPDFISSNMEAEAPGLSPPVILGETIFNIDQGTNDVPIVASIAGSKAINTCQGPAFNIESNIHPSCSAANPNATSTTVFAQGDGSAGDPFVICNRDQLRLLGSTTDVGSRWDKHFLLGRDLNLAGGGGGIDPWDPIATDTHPSINANQFVGSFDGNGLKIQGLTVSRGSNKWNGLFGTLGPGATVTNLVLPGANISGNDKSGVLTGSIKGNSANSIYVRNIFTGGTVVGARSTGGIAGYARGNVEIENVHNAANITPTSTSNYGITGGIVGKVHFFEGAGTGFRIKKAVNLGTIGNNYTGPGNTSNGGIIGFLQHQASTSINTLIEDVANRGEVKGREYVGGLIGKADDSASGTIVIEKSMNVGQVSLQGVSPSPSARLGGLMGSVNGANINNSFTTGYIDKGGTTAPLMFGYLFGNISSVGVTLTNLHYFDNLGDDAANACAGTGAGLCGGATSQPSSAHFYQIGNSPLDTWDFGGVWEAPGATFPILIQAE